MTSTTKHSDAHGRHHNAMHYVYGGSVAGSEHRHMMKIRYRARRPAPASFLTHYLGHQNTYLEQFTWPAVLTTLILC